MCKLISILLHNVLAAVIALSRRMWLLRSATFCGGCEDGDIRLHCLDSRMPSFAGDGSILPSKLSGKQPVMQ